MARATIDFGIDLGTTNSVIAVVNEGQIEVIKNGLHQITPSAVYADTRGTIYRGNAAISKFLTVKTASDVQVEFKREMGQKVSRQFDAAGLSMSPEQLSAEILIELRRAAKERFGSEPNAAVITVPAMFELPQNDATARAAKLAGFQHSMLLQEPVAAAAAYGFQSDANRAYWLVYDLGGGTFDASIVAVRDGQLSVVLHSGDNYLGGADFDRAIVDQLIVPSLRDKYDLSGLERVNAARDKLTKGRLSKLKVIAEELKKNLSRSELEQLFVEDAFQDDSDDPVDVEMKITRSVFEGLIHTQVQKSLDITARLIQDAGLRPKDIDKVLLVGGSTYVPLVQQQIATLGIPVDRTLDPLTVVAHGAAVFASAQRMPKAMTGSVPVAVGTARVELEYEPVVKELTPMVGGKVTVSNMAPPPGAVVTIDRDDSRGWTSGDMPLDVKGRFFTTVQLREKGQSVFKLNVRDAAGTSLPCSPDQFAITYGTTVAKASLPQSVSVGLADGTSVVLLKAGETLPCISERVQKRTIRDLKKGSKDSLPIPFLTGHHKLSELNQVGILFSLNGADIARDVPKGTKVEIVVEVDTSGTAKATITIPLLDQQQFEVKHDSELRHETAEVMRDRVQAIEARLDELAEKAEAAGESTAGREVAAFRAAAVLEEIEQKIELWDNGDAVAAGQARNLLVDAAKKVHELAAKVEWPARVAEYEERKASVRRSVHDHGDPQDQQTLATLIDEGDQAVRAKEPRMLESADRRLAQLGYAMNRRDPAFLAGFLAYLAQQEANFLDRRRGQQLLEEGAIALRRKDSDAMASIIQELLSLLPPEQEAAAQSAIRSGII
ncbi:MAG: Hsp70 family protein [Planctomycetota bacterium]|nr:Hsp70 family protein [Planctomycetota bacterium]